MGYGSKLREQQRKADEEFLEKEFAATQSQTVKIPEATLPSNAGTISFLVAAMVASVICFLFADIYSMTSQQDYLFLGGLSIFLTFFLRSSYVVLSLSRFHDKTYRTSSSTADRGTEILWETLFQTNFWFFIFFGVLEYAVVPSFIDAFYSQNSSNSTKYISWVHALGSTVIPTICTYIVAADKI